MKRIAKKVIRKIVRLLHPAPVLSPSFSARGADNAFLGIQTILLWPDGAPKANGDGPKDTPTLTIFTPRVGSENGSAVVIMPGGGYQNLAGDLEGREIASWFAARGFKAFILAYRLPSQGYLFPVPLLDARRAIQLVRARAREFSISPHRIVAIGFSAGGHLAALAAVQPLAGDPRAADPVERASSRPDYLVLGYPWMSAVSTSTTHLNYCQMFNLMDQSAALEAAYTPNNFVSPQNPPAFIYHTWNDQAVPVEQSLGFVEALHKAGVSTEVHIFAEGKHGSGLGKGDAALGHWANLLENWLRGLGLIPKD
jgi:acetyl esterase/lipase